MVGDQVVLRAVGPDLVASHAASDLLASSVVLFLANSINLCLLHSRTKNPERHRFALMLGSQINARLQPGGPVHRCYTAFRFVSVLATRS